MVVKKTLRSGSVFLLQPLMLPSCISEPIDDRRYKAGSRVPRPALFPGPHIDCCQMERMWCKDSYAERRHPHKSAVRDRHRLPTPGSQGPVHRRCRPRPAKPVLETMPPITPENIKMTPGPEIDGAPGADLRAVLASVERFALRHMGTARGSHDWDHTLRVCRLCDHIGKSEGADLRVVRIAAFLHDIGRSRQDGTSGGICHAREGVRLAEPFLQGLPIDGARKRNILHCIASHRYRGEAVPRTLEARVVFDADKLDAIGAVGVARAFLFAGEVGARLHAPEMKLADTSPYSESDTGYREYMLKLRHIKSRILTAEGRRLADRRHRFMEFFFNRFLDEFDGKR